MSNRAIVLLSGGLDSTTTLAIARSEGWECHVLTVRYGQTHDREIAAAKNVARAQQAASHQVLDIDLRNIAKSALTSPVIAVPKDRSMEVIGAEGDVPATYVPARNTILLSLALAWAETIAASHIFIGVNVLDASGYPDCRPQFISQFEKLAQVATHVGIRKDSPTIRICAPLIEMTKSQIITKGVSLGVDYSLTHTCYEPQGNLSCGKCDACQLRKKGFSEAGLTDPISYI